MEMNKTPGQAAVEPEMITLRELGETCRKTRNCLKCELIEYCNSFARFMNHISPKWWLTAEEQYSLPLPDLKLKKGTYIFKGTEK